MIREKSSILSPKSMVVVFHYSSGEIHSGSVGEGAVVIGVNLVIFTRK